MIDPTPDAREAARKAAVWAALDAEHLRHAAAVRKLSAELAGPGLQGAPGFQAPAERPMSVKQAAPALGMSETTLRRHLRVLRTDPGLTRWATQAGGRRGRWRIRVDVVAELIEQGALSDRDQR